LRLVTQRRRTKPPSGYLIKLLDVAYDDDGRPIDPVALTSTAYICDLGKIITDRTGFQTERYIPGRLQVPALLRIEVDAIHL
jgi:hypothetical protein